MSWGPNDTYDLWNKKTERLVDPEYLRLHYSPTLYLVLELDDDGWSWLEMTNQGKVLTVQKDRFKTSYEAILDYEEVIAHEKH